MKKCQPCSFIKGNKMSTEELNKRFNLIKDGRTKEKEKDKLTIKKLNSIAEYNALGQDICIISPMMKEELLEKIEELFEQMEMSYELKSDCDYKSAKQSFDFGNIKVYGRKPFAIDVEYLTEMLQEYADERWYYDYFDCEIDGKDIIEKFVKDFNEAQTGYTIGEQVAVLDALKEFEQFVKDLRKED